MRVSRLISVSVAASAIVVMAAWFLKWTEFLLLNGSNSVTQFNTALAFLLASVAIYFSSKNNKTLASLISLALLVLAGTTISQYIFDISLGIDELFVEHYLDLPTDGRMGPNTAFCFVLIAINLLIFNSTISKTVIKLFHSVTVPIVAVLALVSLVGHIIGNEFAYGWGELPKMALYTTLLFAALSIALHRFHQVNWQLADYIPALSVAMLVFLISIWNVLHTQQIFLAEQANLQAHSHHLADSVPFLFLVFGLFSTVFITALFYAVNHLRIKNRQADKLSMELRAVNTKLSMTNEQLQRSNSHFIAVVEAAPVAMLLTDQDGVIELVNHRTCELFCYESDQLVGQKVEMLMPSEYRESHSKLRFGFSNTPGERVMQAGRDFVGVDANGKELALEISISSFEIDSGRKLLASMVDITERMRNTEKLAKINRELNNFIHVASHDLRSPLRGIAQLSGWILEDYANLLPDEGQNYLSLIQSRINRMDRLLDDLLSYTRLKWQKPKLVDIDTKAVVSEVFNLMVANNKFELKFVTEMPVLKTAKVPFEMVVRNLIDNAIKHNNKKKGRIEFGANLQPDAIEFFCKDNGPGISPEMHQRIFEIFQTLRPKDEVEGSGVGLAIVKKTLDLYGGGITVESDGKTGTTFYFMWPITLKDDQYD